MTYNVNCVRYFGVDQMIHINQNCVQKNPQNTHVLHEQTSALNMS